MVRLRMGPTWSCCEASLMQNKVTRSGCCSKVTDEQKYDWAEKQQQMHKWQNFLFSFIQEDSIWFFTPMWSRSDFFSLQVQDGSTINLDQKEFWQQDGPVSRRTIFQADDSATGSSVSKHPSLCHVLEQDAELAPGLLNIWPRLWPSCGERQVSRKFSYRGQ